MSVILDVKNLTRYFGGIAAVNDVSFRVNKGEILGLIGPNGAGKSTTFNLISGFYKLSTGEIYYKNKNITNKSPEYLRKQGLVRTFQHNILFNEMTAYENIYLGAALTKGTKKEKNDIVMDVLAFLKLEPFRDELTKNLPHGLQRMLGIGIALATRPKLLLLDEPLTGMNQTETADALEIFNRIRLEREITIVIVEHNMKAVMEICNRIVVLTFGQKLAEGTPKEVSTNDKVIRAYLGGNKNDS